MNKYRIKSENRFLYERMNIPIMLCAHKAELVRDSRAAHWGGAAHVSLCPQPVSLVSGKVMTSTPHVLIGLHARSLPLLVSVASTTFFQCCAGSGLCFNGRCEHGFLHSLLARCSRDYWMNDVNRIMRLASVFPSSRKENGFKLYVSSSIHNYEGLKLTS